MKDFDIEKVLFGIRKSTPKLYDRMIVFLLEDGTYKILLTSNDGEEFKDYEKHNKGVKYLSVFINHECLHIIFYEFVSKRAACKYDKFLKTIGIYHNEGMLKDWL